jgi:hypothetical protein
MTDSNNRNRVSKGVPTGGQYQAEHKLGTLTLPSQAVSQNTDEFEKVVTELREAVEAQGFSIEYDGDSIEVGIGYYEKDRFGHPVYVYGSRRVTMRDEDHITEDLGADTLLWSDLAYKDGVLSPMDCSEDNGQSPAGCDADEIISTFRDFVDDAKFEIECQVRDHTAFWEEPDEDSE